MALPLYKSSAKTSKFIFRIGEGVQGCRGRILGGGPLKCMKLSPAKANKCCNLNGPALPCLPNATPTTPTTSGHSLD